MNIKEILWRIDQKKIQKKEEYYFGKQKKSVCQDLFYSDSPTTEFNENNLGINFKNSIYKQQTNIHLLGGFEYETYKLKWHCGFQTNLNWPIIFSYKLNYKQCDRIGDARTNWELNRHFQFTLLAKAFYTTKDSKYLNDLKYLFNDWEQNNPFLYGISWTSVMEIAIRSISWMFTLSFLKKSNIEDKTFLRKIEIGILNMIGYIEKHYSRFSSANNHLIVEATAIGLAGFCFNSKRWQNLSIHILTKELYTQNYSDGINKELSLHYQTFVMEAYALISHCMLSNHIEIPIEWKNMLTKMCQYVSHCSWNEENVCEFGDNDEGKILDLEGNKINHYNYVLQFCSLILQQRFSSFNKASETIHWLFPKKEIEQLQQLTLYNNTKSYCFSTGGNSFLRDKKNNILIGIDHAALGFGSIAAHGHADALSFQLLIKGIPLFIDPGTYIYHCNLEARNSFRKTINHNTVCINQKDQSEMLGAFLWGKKANCTLDYFESNESKDILSAHHDGYAPIIHYRTYEWDKINNILQIKDSINKEAEWCTTFMLNSICKVKQEKQTFYIGIENRMTCILYIESNIKDAKIEQSYLSQEYGTKETTKAIRIYAKNKELKTRIEIINI